MVAVLWSESIVWLIGEMFVAGYYHEGEEVLSSEDDEGDITSHFSSILNKPIAFSAHSDHAFSEVTVW